MAAVWLLKIPGFLLVGSIDLIWIAYQMKKESGAETHDKVAGATNFRTAIQTIVVADAITGLDNVLVATDAANGSFLRWCRRR